LDIRAAPGLLRDMDPNRLPVTPHEMALGIHQIRRLGTAPFSRQRRAGRRDSALPRQMHYVRGRLISVVCLSTGAPRTPARCFFLSITLSGARNTRRLFWCRRFTRGSRELLTEIAKQHEVTLHVVEVMPDHVPIFVEGDPTRCVDVNGFKGRTSLYRGRNFRSPALRCGAGVISRRPLGRVSKRRKASK
jgi:hypothetical protein